MARSHGTKGAQGRSLKRWVAVRNPRRTILIFCEGEKTEPEYLEALKRQSWVRDGAAVDFQLQNGLGGSVSSTLVGLLSTTDLTPRRFSNYEKFPTWCP